MTRLVVDQRWRTVFEQLGLLTSRQVIDHFGGRAAVAEPKVIIRRHLLHVPDGPTEAIFLKQYCYPGASYRFWFRASKAYREFASYAVFERLGICCAQRIAAGEDRDLTGRLRHAFIVTRAVPNAGTLLDVFASIRSTRGSAAGHAPKLRHQLAAMTRRIHDAAFYHND